MPVFLRDSMAGMEKDMQSMDTIALPMALAVLAYILQVSEEPCMHVIHVHVHASARDGRDTGT